KRLFVAVEGARAYLWVRGEGFLAAEGEDAASVALECHWRVGAAGSQMHRRQPGADCERLWRRAEELSDGLRVCPEDGGPDGQTLQASHAPIERAWSLPARAQMRFLVPVREDGTLDFWLCWRLDGEEAGAPAPAETAFAEAEQALMDFIGRPLEGVSPLVARAMAWGKIGSRRVWHRYATGDQGFTNDPPGSVVVTRDAAWFVFGADHFAPEWSRALLETLARYAPYPGGKIAEYVRLSPSDVERNDYGLNINDATPLFVLSVAHYWQATGDREALRRFYPAARDAAEWILGQRREDGLVWCDGRGTNVFGIGGWRNIIPGYRLAGALTELNAECVAALRGAGEMAAALGESEDAARFTAAAADLGAAMAQLVDPETGFFYLTRDENGPHPQLTIDLAFPALFQAGPEEARVRTLLRLVEPDFRGPHGLSTLSKDDPAYHPRFGFGLMGGSWPNATTWVAAALAPYRLDLAWELAEEIARALWPETWSLPGVSVPGQFPEWFDGGTGESQGMSLSPWMPATYVWLIEKMT
ncbi:MAG TPA: amylo-alpha-1,6-glucosidase, partial [Chthonomonadaceae bacterium]|nr:amylo-alpha-1,6-glucosidase [Chthonomonadaceae bacterium]